MDISTRTEKETQRGRVETQIDRQRQAYRTSPSLRAPMIRLSARVWYESTYVAQGFIANVYLRYITYPLCITLAATRPRHSPAKLRTRAIYAARR